MSDESPAATRTPATVWIVIAVLAAVVVFSSTLAVIEWRRADNLRHKENLRRTAATAAAQFGTALYNYDFNDLPGARARVLRLATAKYAKGYDAASPAQQATITRLKVREAGKVTGAFLTDVVGDRAAAVVILDTALQSTEGTRRSVSYLDLALVRQGSAWKVDTAKPVTVAP
jgi:hypothetical protein